MPVAFHRSRQTWLFYLVFSVYGYVLNGMGPITPFLKAELNLSYVVTSLHFSAFAVGMILAGLGGNLVVARLGRKPVLLLGLFGMSICQLVVAVGSAAWMTVGASFLMGGIGSLLASVVPPGLSEEHGENRPIALSELNLVAAIGSVAAPLAVGWLSYTALGWRFALVVPLAFSLFVWFFLGRRTRLLESPSAQLSVQSDAGGLPRRFWLYWLTIILMVAIEYCMVFWCADYLETVAGLTKSQAAQAVSLYLVGMIAGRVVASRLLVRFKAFQILTVSLLIAGAGFLVYWSALTPWLGLVGVFITGTGVASLYPLTLSMALGAAGGHTVQASTRAGLASGIAILLLPLILGRVADGVGIRLAYLLVVGLMVAAFALTQWTERGATRVVSSD